MVISHLDHLVLTVQDAGAACQFYGTVLGMEVVTNSNGRKALRFGDQKINLHEAGREPEPKAARPTVGAADLCFITETPLEQVLGELKEHQVPVLSGIVERTGAMCRIRSVYLRDPDQNLIELSNYLEHLPVRLI
jgi:catechol 2,3-dioxygenase-like lactoylglutathione lyase family enzyme